VASPRAVTHAARRPRAADASRWKRTSGTARRRSSSSACRDRRVRGGAAAACAAAFARRSSSFRVGASRSNLAPGRPSARKGPATTLPIALALLAASPSDPARGTRSARHRSASSRSTAGLRRVGGVYRRRGRARDAWGLETRASARLDSAAREAARFCRHRGPSHSGTLADHGPPTSAASWSRTLCRPIREPPAALAPEPRRRCVGRRRAPAGHSRSRAAGRPTTLLLAGAARGTGEDDARTAARRPAALADRRGGPRGHAHSISVGRAPRGLISRSSACRRSVHRTTRRRPPRSSAAAPGFRPGRGEPCPSRRSCSLTSCPSSRGKRSKGCGKPLEGRPSSRIARAAAGARPSSRARFQLVGTMNMCPCGGRGDPACAVHVLAAAISPRTGTKLFPRALLDRFDLVVPDVPRPRAGPEPRGGNRPSRPLRSRHTRSHRPANARTPSTSVERPLRTRRSPRAAGRAAATVWPRPRTRRTCRANDRRARSCGRRRGRARRRSTRIPGAVGACRMKELAPRRLRGGRPAAPPRPRRPTSATVVRTPAHVSTRRRTRQSWRVAASSSSGARRRSFPPLLGAVHDSPPGPVRGAGSAATRAASRAPGGGPSSAQRGLLGLRIVDRTDARAVSLRRPASSSSQDLARAASDGAKPIAGAPRCGRRPRSPCLGCGNRSRLPRRGHAQLAGRDRVERSRRPPSTPPRSGGPHHGDSQRVNRIIAGLCAATIVVEARETKRRPSSPQISRSRRGREVFAVPGENR